jgi:hypothetical protein
VDPTTDVRGPSVDAALGQPAEVPSQARRWAFLTVGLAAGFSGIAVITTILTGVPLAIAEAAFVLVPLAAVINIVRRSPRPIVIEVARVGRIGAVAGFVATMVYDVTRTAGSYFDPSPYNPFEAIRQFGLGMVPESAPLPLIMVAGFGIHALNGASFGVIYAVFAGRHVRTWRAALFSGIAWGLTLEFIQSILYPGWLRITTVIREFLVISGIGHLAYGAALGALSQLLIRRGWLREGRT